MFICFLVVQVPEVNLASLFGERNRSVVYSLPLILVCSAKSFVNVSFQWSGPENQPLNPVTEYNGVSMYKSTINIASAMLDSIGWYTCTVTNTAGTSSDSVYIDVYGEQINYKYIENLFVMILCIKKASLV